MNLMTVYYNTDETNRMYYLFKYHLVLIGVTIGQTNRIKKYHFVHISTRIENIDISTGKNDNTAATSSSFHLISIVFKITFS